MSTEPISVNTVLADALARIATTAPDRIVRVVAEVLGHVGIRRRLHAWSTG
jgi:hypothetical protein